jgi:hypothetical protein
MLFRLDNPEGKGNVHLHPDSFSVSDLSVLPRRSFPAKVGSSYPTVLDTRPGAVRDDGPYNVLGQAYREVLLCVISVVSPRVA